MTRILAIADEESPSLNVAAIRKIGPDMVVSCGDLPFDYLDYVASAANVSLLYVPGNHDPALKPELRPVVPSGLYEREWGESAGPPGINLDGRIVAFKGVTFAGLGGSIRYSDGPNQYTEWHMRWRAIGLATKARWRKLTGRGGVDVLVTHSPPRGLGDDDDPAHRGFESFRWLLARLGPKVMIHGHVHPHGFVKPDREVGGAALVNVVPYKVIEVAP